MRSKKYIAYLVVLALLAAYYGYFEVYRKGLKEQEAEAQKKVFEVKFDEVDQIKISPKDRDDIILSRKDGDDWTIEKPLLLKGDKMEVEELIGNLNKIERQMVITEKAEDLNQYGLDTPLLKIEFHAGEKWSEINFGEKNPISNDYYTQVKNSDQIFVTASSTYQILNKDLFTLRDKAVFSMQSPDVDGVEFSKGDLKAVVQKNSEDNTQWNLAGNDDFRVKSDALDDITRQFAWLRATSFIQETDENLEKFGLNRPRASISMKKGDTREALQIGSHFEDDKAYAKKVGKPGVFTIEERYLNVIPGSLKELEDRSIFDFKVENADVIDWNIGDDRYKLKKVEGKWSWEVPDGRNKVEVDNWAVEGALWKLKDLEYVAEEEVSAPVTGEKMWEITVKGNEGNVLAGLVAYSEDDHHKDEVTAEAAMGKRHSSVRIHSKSLQDVRQKFAELGEKKI